MRYLIVFIVLFISNVLVKGQATYYWVGGTGSTANISFTLGSKWNTSLDGTGTSRPAQDPTDILIIDGTNVGGATPVVGAVTATCGSTNFGRLILRNNAMLTIVRPTTGTGTITINGDGTTADDLLINSGCMLTMTVADSINTTSGNNLLLAPTATGRILGTLFLNGGACRITASNPATGGSCFFENGSLCKANTQITYYPFGNSSGVPGAVVFNSGSKLLFMGGNSVFTSTSTYNPIVFKTGSTFRIETSIPSTTVSSSNLFSGRTFSNVEIGNNATVVGDFFYNIDNLTIDPGASFFIKTSGASPVSGNIINNGTFGSATGFTSSNLLMKGIQPQSISGNGVYQPLGALSVATDADVTLNRSITINGTSNSLINGKLNLQTYTISGTGTLQTKNQQPVTVAVTTGIAGTYNIVLDAAVYNGSTNNAGVYNGILVTGNGVPPNTYVIGTSSSASTVTLSNPLTGTVSSVVFSGNVPVIRTANVNGIDGSIGGCGVLSLTTSTDYIFDGPTSQPFSNISLGAVRNVTFNASATTNRGIWIDSMLTVNNGMLSIRPTDTIRIRNGKPIGGAPFSDAKHIALLTNSNAAGTLRIDQVGTPFLFPIGSSDKYLPVLLQPTSISSLTASVFEGITSDATPNGAPLSNTELLKVVNAVWNIGRVSGSGDIGINLKWNNLLEGTIFSSQPDSRIGVIQNSGTTWSAPFGTADNLADTAFATVTSVGSFSVGAVPQVSPFSFGALAPKTYGNPDFNCGVVSLNTVQPVIYSSSDPSVATISPSGMIHIVGVGTTLINAAQASDGIYLAANETQQLIVTPAMLTITADNKTRFEGTANPVLTVTYNGFVYNENESVLSGTLSLATTAVVSSVPGNYPIVPSGLNSLNYNINYVNGILTVLARQTQVITFSPLGAVTYGTPDFSANVFSNNNSIPVMLSSSNPAVATIVNGSQIHITGAGITIITASQAGDAAHLPANDVAVQFTVNKAPLTITAVDTFKLQGATNPVFRLSYSGFVLGENESVFNTQAFVQTNASAASIPGLYNLHPDLAQADNYSFSYVDGKLTIYPQDSSLQSINVYPSMDGLNIKFFSPIPDIGRLYLLDLNGRALMHQDILVTKGFTSINMKLPVLPAACYAVCFRGKKNTLSRLIFLNTK